MLSLSTTTTTTSTLRAPYTYYTGDVDLNHQ